MVTLSIAVTPPRAKVYLDGALIGRGSVSVVRAASPDEHKLRVVAPGHEARSRRLVLDRSRTIEIHLSRRRSGATPKPKQKPEPGEAGGDLQRNPYR
jgi:hypothetical protein